MVITDRIDDDSGFYTQTIPDKKGVLAFISTDPTERYNIIIKYEHSTKTDSKIRKISIFSGKGDNLIKKIMTEIKNKMPDAVQVNIAPYGYSKEKVPKNFTNITKGELEEIIKDSGYHKINSKYFDENEPNYLFNIN